MARRPRKPALQPLALSDLSLPELIAAIHMRTLMRRAEAVSRYGTHPSAVTSAAYRASEQWMIEHKDVLKKVICLSREAITELNTYAR